MAMGTRLFRVFVSSTFADLRLERDALQKNVFPAIADYCTRAGYGFQAIDLRWGIGDEASLDQRTVSICLNELSRCQAVSPRPNFIVLLGQRYGWRPLPSEIEMSEYEIVYRHLAVEARDLAAEWYVLDENAVPCVNRLRPRTGPRESDPAFWASVERRLRPALYVAAQAAGLDEVALRKYWMSATAQEIEAGALSIPNPADAVFAYVRSIAPRAEVPAASDVSDSIPGGPWGEEDDDLLRGLKQRLSDAIGHAHVFEYEARWTDDTVSAEHLDQLCRDVATNLRRVIDEEIARIASVSHLDREITAHAAFAGERRASFTGRARYLDEIAKYLGADSPYAFVVYGDGGTGKSALLAQAAYRARSANPDAVVIERYIGATPASATPRSLLQDLHAEIGRAYGVSEPAPGDFSELIRAFHERLALARPDRPLRLFLDSLDHLSATYDVKGITWFPITLPPSVRLVASTRPGEEFDAVRRTIAKDAVVRLEEMSVGEGEQLLDAWLARARRRLTDAQRGAVLESFTTYRLPLQLRLAFEVARRWSSYDPPQSLPPDVRGMVTTVYDSLEKEHGALLAGRSLAYLAASRGTNGLAEDEILAALSGDEDVFTEFTARAKHTPPEPRLPVVVWSRLFFDLEPYLAARTSDNVHVMAFYHRELAEAARERYLAQEPPARHTVLARVFRALADPDGDASWDGRPRALAELPYHLVGAKDWGRVFRLLTDFTFLEKKAMSVGVVTEPGEDGSGVTLYTGVFALIDDYEWTLKEFPAT